MPGASHLDRIIQSARRRLTWSRRIHRIEICLLITAATAMVTSTILLLARQPSLPISTIIFAAGALLAIISAALVRIRPIEAAMELDRRFALKDLLATAVAVRTGGSPGDSWTKCFMAAAEIRCQSLPAIHSTANQRIWIAITLATLLSLTLGFWIPIPAPDQKGGREPLLSQAVREKEGLPSPLFSVGRVAPADRPAGGANVDEPSPRNGSLDSASPGENKSDQSPGGDHGASGNPAGTASGVGLAQTSAHIQTIAQLPQQPATAALTKNTTTAGGASGVPPTSSGAAPDGQSDHSSSPTVPPWQTGAWPAAEAAANASLQNGQIDPSYQDLVRDYFSRP